MSDYLKYKDWYDKNAAEWAKNNPERRREIANKYNQKESTKLAKRRWHDLKKFGHVIDRSKCEKCDSVPKTLHGLVIHHVDGNNGKLGKPLNNDRDNLIVLCRSCHAKIHYKGVVKELSWS